MSNYAQIFQEINIKQLSKYQWRKDTSSIIPEVTVGVVTFRLNTQLTTGKQGIRVMANVSRQLTRTNGGGYAWLALFTFSSNFFIGLLHVIDSPVIDDPLNTNARYIRHGHVTFSGFTS